MGSIDGHLAAAAAAAMAAAQSKAEKLISENSKLHMRPHCVDGLHQEMASFQFLCTFFSFSFLIWRLIDGRTRKRKTGSDERETPEKTVASVLK